METGSLWSRNWEMFESNISFLIKKQSQILNNDDSELARTLKTSMASSFYFFFALKECELSLPVPSNISSLEDL